MTSFLSLPGIGGSDAAHWQSQWEAGTPSFTRFQPADWDRPDLEDWLHALDSAIAQAATPPVLVAHSLACLLVAHAADRIADRVAGAFLVAVPDPDGAAFPAEAAGFARPPRRPLPFPAVIVASSNDPYASLDHVTARAEEWNARVIDIGAHGHINSASGLGSWTHGRQLLEAFCAGVRA